MVKILLALLLALVVAPSPARAQTRAGACDRASFGGFVQQDRRDTRYWVLVAQAIGVPSFRTGAGGKVLVERGSWVDPYTGRLMADVPANQLEIDHIIPICWAWARGAHLWDRDTRRAFYNDRRFLVAVEAGLNRQKGALGPDRFMPMSRGFACDYVELFLAGVAEYRLSMRKAETAAIAEVRELACGPGSRAAPPRRPPGIGG